MNLNLPSFGTDPLIFGFLLLVAFLVLREIFTWYWKINRIVSLLEQIEKNTRKDAPLASEKAPGAPVRKGPFS